MDEYSPERSTTDTNFTGKPKYWGNWDATTLIVAPTPNVAYTVEMWYDETPERLGKWFFEDRQLLLYQIMHLKFYYVELYQKRILT